MLNENDLFCQLETLMDRGYSIGKLLGRTESKIDTIVHGLANATLDCLHDPTREQVLSVMQLLEMGFPILWQTHVVDVATGLRSLEVLFEPDVVVELLHQRLVSISLSLSSQSIGCHIVGSQDVLLVGKVHEPELGLLTAVLEHERRLSRYMPRSHIVLVTKLVEMEFLAANDHNLLPWVVVIMELVILQVGPAIVSDIHVEHGHFEDGIIVTPLVQVCPNSEGACTRA